MHDAHTFSVPAAAAALGISESTMRRRVKRGEVASLRLTLGGHPRVVTAAVMRALGREVPAERELPALLTLRETAQLLGVHRTTVAQGVRDGLVPTMRLAGYAAVRVPGAWLAEVTA